MAAIGLALSIVGFVAARDGGTYLVWSGAIVGGLAMVVRGRGVTARAKALDS